MVFSGTARLTSSQKIIKIKYLLKKDFDIDNVKVDNTNDDETNSRLLSHTGTGIRTSFISREVAVNIAGHIAKKVKND